MKLELDFLQEATNAERIGNLFKNNRHIYIPKIRWDLSSHRVLTMEYIDGVKVTEVKTLKDMHINPAAVGETISSLFSLMIFSFGLVHTDPHAGNLLIRHPPSSSPASSSSDVGKNNGSGWKQWVQWPYHRLLHLLGLPLYPNFQVVLLDHGMYRRLNETFRASYCNLWKAFMTRDEALGRKTTKELGLEEEYFEVLSLISVNRTTSSKGRIGEGMSPEERKAIREKYKDREKYSAEKVSAARMPMNSGEHGRVFSTDSSRNVSLMSSFRLYKPYSNS